MSFRRDTAGSFRVSLWIWNDSSRKQYTCKVERIDNNRKYSVGMLLFANSKNEVFNPLALKVASLSIYSDQGYAVFNTSY